MEGETVEALEIVEPVIDLHFHHFFDSDYENLTNKIRKEESKTADLKIIDQ